MVFSLLLILFFLMESTAQESNNINKKDQAILHVLQVYEQAFLDSQILQKAEITSLFPEQFPEDYSKPFTIQTIRGAKDDPKQIVWTFSILETTFDENENLLYLRFSPQLTDDEKNLFFDYFLIKKDELGHIQQCLFLKTKQDDLFKKQSHKFLDGKYLEYGAFNKFNEPSSYACKTFTLNEKGGRIITHAKERSNRRFNDKGLIVSETTRESTYSYIPSITESPYDLYNVSFYPDGTIHTYDLVFKKALQEADIKDPFHISVYSTWTSEKILSKKLVRKFTIQDQLKKYTEGTEVCYFFDDKKRIQRIEETDFLILQGADGFTSSGRMQKKSRTTYNLSFDDKDRIIMRRVLETHTPHQDFDKSQEIIRLFTSLKEIHLDYNEKSKLSNILINYFDYEETTNISLTRQVTISILEFDPAGTPVKVMIQILSKENPAQNAEMTFTQDCQYVIDEALYGDLFFQKSDKQEKIQIIGVSETGEITDAILQP